MIRKILLSKTNIFIVSLFFIFQICLGLFLPANFSVFVSGFFSNQKAYASGESWLSGYSYRKKITIDHTKVGGSTNLTDFPALISLATADLKTTVNGGKVENANGYDIVYTASDGSTRLDHEVEVYTADSGTIAHWVRIPTLSYTADTEIYIYYGNSSVSTSQENVSAVWASHYKAVYHMNDLTSTTIKDSTANGNNGTKASAGNPNTDTGKIGQAQYFSSTPSDYIALPNNAFTALNSGSVQAWLKVNSTTTVYHMFGSGATQNVFFGHLNDNRPYIQTYPIPNYAYKTTSTLGSGFSHVCWESNGSTWSAFMNGGSAETLIPVGGSNNGDWFNDLGAGTAATTLGRSSYGAYYFGGWIDEFRISSTQFTQGWNTTEYNNQNSPATFISLSGEEAASATPADPTSPLQYKSNGTDLIVNNGATYENSVKLQASATDADLSETISLFFESATSTDSFNSPATPTAGGSCVSGTSWNDCASKIWYTSSTAGDYSSTPFTGTTTVAGLDNGSYKWQVKACDDDGDCSAWVAYNASTPNFTANTSAFVSTWDTTKAGSASNQIVLPLESTGTYNFTAYWGDGSTSTITAYNQAEVTHTYSTPGIYDVIIIGTITGFRFNNGGDKLKISDIKQWGSLRVGNSNGYFYGCANLNASATDALDLTGTTNLSSMFRTASVFNGNIGNWDTSSVTNMSDMFYYASAFNQNIGSWNTGNVINMFEMFSYASVFNQNIGTWNVSSVTDMSYMFSWADAFNGDISSWNTGNVTNMSYMFNHDLAFNQNIGNWDVSKVTTTKYMFSQVANFNYSLASWNVSSVTDMSYMFNRATTFNGDISSWNVSNVTDTRNMFYNVTAFNQNISTWNTANVTNMSNMFYGATAFNQNIGSWNVAKVTSMASMFTSVTLSVINYDALLNGWNSQALKTGVTFSGGSSKYCTGSTARANIISTYTWTITDGGLSPTCDVGEPDIVAVDAGPSDSNRTSLTSASWFKYSDTGSDDAISFSWTDPASLSDDTFYYELNVDSGSTITGDETTTTNPYIDSIAITEGTSYFHIRPRNGVNTWGTERIFEVKYDKIAPSGGSINFTDGYYNSNSVALTVSDGTDLGSGINDSSRQTQRMEADFSGNVCGAFGAWGNISPDGTYPNLVDNSVSSGKCYQYQYLVSDNAVNQIVYSSANTAKIDSSTPDIVVVDAGTSNIDRTSLTSASWFKYSDTGSDDQISFSWTDPTSITDDTFYYELNANSGNTITGDEATATNPYIDSITIAEGTSYFHVRPKNGAGNWGTERIFTIKYDKTSPATFTLDSITESSDYLYVSGATIYTNNAVATPGSFTLDFSAIDAISDIYQASGETAFGDTPTDNSSPYQLIYSVEQGSISDNTITLTASDNASNTAIVDLIHINDTTAPTGGSITYADGYTTSTSITITTANGTDAGSGINSSGYHIQRREAVLSGGACGSFGSWSNILPTGAYPNYSDDSVVSGNCYQYQYLESDNVANQATYTSTNVVKVDTSALEIATVTAGPSSADRASLLAGIWFNYSNTGSDDQISFAWTDPASVSDDTFYYELNTDSGNTISGDESNTTSLFVDDITISEGTSYFHVKSKNGADTWGTERTFAIKYDKTKPTISLESIYSISNYIYFSGSTLYVNNASTTPGSFTLNLTASDTISSIYQIAGEVIFSDNPTDLSSPYQLIYSVEQDAVSDGIITLTATDNAGNSESIDLPQINDITAPTGGSITYTDGYHSSTAIALTLNDGSDTESGIATTTRQVQRKEASLSNGICGSFGSWSNITPDGTYPNLTDNSAGTGKCYQYQYTVSDNVSNQITYTSANTVKTDTATPDITAVYAGSFDGDRASLVNGDWISYYLIGSDDLASFSWGDPSPSSGAVYYYELNTNSSDTITGDEATTTNLFIDDISITEGTSYFHVKPRNNASTWGTERVFTVKYDKTAPTGISLLSLVATASNELVATVDTGADAVSNLSATPYWFGEETGNPGNASSTAWQTGTTFTATGLSANTLYTLKAKGRDTAGNESAYSSTISKYTLANPVSDLTATNASTKTYNQINLAWTNQGQSGIRIEQDTNCDGTYDYSNYDSATVNPSSPRLVTGLNSNTCYKFKISSYNQDGVLNTIATAVTAEITTPPTNPTTLSAETITSDSIIWNWEDVTGATGYKVYNSADDALLTTISTVNSTWTQDSLTPNSIHSIYVRSTNANGEGLASLAVSTYTKANQPSALFGTASARTISLSWNANSNPAGTEFKINNTTASTTSGWVTSTNWESTDLVCGTSYSFQVKSRNTNNLESEPTETSISTSACPISNTGGGSPEVYQQPTQPSSSAGNPTGGFKVIVNNGADTTNQKQVFLSLFAGSDIVNMAISNNENFSAVSLEPFSQTKTWTLSDGDGSKTVYVKFYTRYGQASTIVSDSVVLDTQAPTVRLNQTNSSYPENQAVIISGVTEANAYIFLNWNSQYGLIIADNQGNWQANLGTIPVGQNQIKVSAKDGAGNLSSDYAVDINVVKAGAETQTQPKTITTTITETAQSIIDKILNQTTDTTAENAQPITIPQVAPPALKAQWTIFTPNLKDNFLKPVALAQLPDMRVEFPNTQSVSESLGFAEQFNWAKLENNSLLLPSATSFGLFGTNTKFNLFANAQINQTSTFPVDLFANTQVTPIGNFSEEMKQNLPAELFFAQSEDGKIDLNTSLAVNQQGEVWQKLELTTNQKILLTIKPAGEVESITGYLIFKPEGSSADLGIISQGGSVLGTKISASSTEPDMEKKLVLTQFDFKPLDNSGLYVANLETPPVDGHYEILSLVKYKENEEVKAISLETVIDPEGYVYENLNGREVRIQGAQVTLHQYNEDSGEYSVWPGEEFVEKNPQITDRSGKYFFLVPRGQYYLEVNHPDYESYKSEVFPVLKGKGVHMNIELVSRWKPIKEKDWQNLLLWVFVVANFCLLLLIWRRMVISQNLKNLSKDNK